MFAAEEVCIPPPQFICKSPKYPTVFKPFGSPSLPPKTNYPLNNSYSQHKFKRKCLGSDAEKACAKEAQASRITLANLRKVMASTPQVHSFIVEESFNETTVENFIPNVEDNAYTDNLNGVDFANSTIPAQGNPTSVNKALNIIPLSGNNQGLTAEKIKHILGNDQVEIMFQTSDGNFVNVSDEVLLNLSKGGLQYQVVDENGHVGELQELKTLDSEGKPTNFDESASINFKKDVFGVKIIQNGDNLNKTEKSSSGGEFIDTSFTTSTKTNLDAIPLINESLYGNGFNMQSTEIFEPENLSLHSDLMADNPIGFVPVNDIKYKYLLPKIGSGKNEEIDLGPCDIDSKPNEPSEVLTENNTEILKTSDENPPSLKFTPDMFFADLPGNECTQNLIKNPLSNGNVL